MLLGIAAETLHFFQSPIGTFIPRRCARTKRPVKGFCPPTLLYRPPCYLLATVDFMASQRYRVGREIFSVWQMAATGMFLSESDDWFGKPLG